MTRTKSVSDPSQVVAYLRVSTGSQAVNGHSLDGQRAAIEADCARRGWTLVATYTETGSGSRADNRPELQRALRAVQSVAGTLMVSSLSRISRSIQNFADIMADAREQGWNIVALDLGVDLSTASGQLVANVMASVAEWERITISERTKTGLAAAKAKGVRLGRNNLPTIPDGVRARILAEHAEGVTPTETARRLNADAVATARGGTWRQSTVRAVVYPANR
jgi:DNA invertase Pin-like site-specific DNA recombinase